MLQNNTSTHSTASASEDLFQIPESGPLIVLMTNDYLFRALLQRNNKVLKGLICSLLHVREHDITSVIITNPIQLGRKFEDKDFILDVNVIMNHQKIINLEMQVINLHNWTDRSLCYLCRNFDQLKQGEPYQNVNPIIQIGFLDYTLFPDSPEFYATYQILNVKSHRLYSDKMRLSVLDLTRIDLATKEDIKYQLNYWASLFKSTTWEELRMLAENNEYMKEVSDTVYHLTQEEGIRQQCEARQDYYRTMNGINDLLQEQDKTIAAQKIALDEKDALIASLQAQLAEKNMQ